MGAGFLDNDNALMKGRNMLKKIFTILSKWTAGLFLVYLVIGFVFLPLISWLIIPWQGNKILKTSVKVSSVFVNPLLLKVTINGFKILDQQDPFGF